MVHEKCQLKPGIMLSEFYAAELLQIDPHFLTNSFPFLSRPLEYASLDPLVQPWWPLLTD